MSCLENFITSIESEPTGASFELAVGRLRIDFITERIVRVRATANENWSTGPSLMRVEVGERPGVIRLEQTEKSVTLRSSQLSAIVDRVSAAVSFIDANGNALLCESATPRLFSAVKVFKSVADPATARLVRTVDGEREMVDYIETYDRDAWATSVNFNLTTDEALYGLGFDETSDLNLRGTTRRLYQHNLRIVVPSMVSTKGYGLLFDAYSAMTFVDNEDGMSIGFDVVDELVYYFILGPTMDGAVAGYRQLTGAAAMLPRWSLGYVQSKERYKTQDELVATLKEFRDRQIPIDTIVQDWNYWKENRWGSFVPDPQFYPDIAAMTAAVHALDAHVMISIWPNPSRWDPPGKALTTGGHTLAGTVYVDFFQPLAGGIYYGFVEEYLGRHGIDAWWCDSTEPVVKDWTAQRPSDADSVNIDALSKLIDAQFLNAYALLGSKSLYQHWRTAHPQQRVVNLTRSGYAGSQRFGATMWTGDISATWETLAQQLPQLLNFSAAGNPYVTTDIGGFFVKRGEQWFWKGDYDGGAGDLGYRELYTRWFQFGVFLSMFRSHGTDTPREPWHFGGPGTLFYDAILESINLRYRLLPYLYSLMGQVHLKHKSFLRPLAFDYPTDLKTHDLKTQFLVGDALMVCPVLNPMYFGPGSKPLDNVPKTREVYLPGGLWIDFWTGESIQGGTTITAEAPLQKIPLFVKAGSILPFGPQVQHANAKLDAPIELRIYPGAHGEYELYEDAGDGWGYEAGEWSIIPTHWEDTKKTLTLGDRRGEFPGMVRERMFHVTVVSSRLGVGLLLAEKFIEIRYFGKSVRASFSD